MAKSLGPVCAIKIASKPAPLRRRCVDAASQRRKTFGGGLLIESLAGTMRSSTAR